jgi:hypothetical protein
MEILVESFPFVFGVLLGISAHRMGNLRKRWPSWAGACIALGAFATLCTGEFRLSLLYFAFDIGLVAAVGAATIALLVELRRRRQHEHG